MARCTIERTLGDVGATLVRAKREADKFGSVWDGDVEKGAYVLRTPLGTVEGTYAVDGDKLIRFLVEKKPAIVPCALIERILDQFLRASP
jgi:hypothetical protein